jgi:N-acetylglucosamine kinase-like BadF-type ATPase
MILIADSGSTKTDWAIIDDKGEILKFKSEGLNPYFTSDSSISQIIEKTFLDFDNKNEVSEIHFYGAGCNSKEKNSIIKTALKNTFKAKKINVESDILGAAKSLFQNSSGIAVILGTGSSSCEYDGGAIIKNIGSFGYILGDEGSGSNIGKNFISAYLNNEIPEKIKQKFDADYRLSVSEIIENVYRKPNPNRFLASFTKFVNDYIEDETLEMLVSECFYDLFTRKLTKYELNKNKIAFIGSVAYYFSDLLKEVAEEFDAEILKIEKSPMNGLIEFHSKKE